MGNTWHNNSLDIRHYFLFSSILDKVNFSVFCILISFLVNSDDNKVINWLPFFLPAMFLGLQVLLWVQVAASIQASHWEVLAFLGYFRDNRQHNRSWLFQILEIHLQKSFCLRRNFVPNLRPGKWNGEKI